MSNGHANCIFAVCCPPESEGQIQALAEEIASAVKLGGGAEHAGKMFAQFVLANYDLAPKGSLQAFKDSIRDLAREGYVKAKEG